MKYNYLHDFRDIKDYEDQEAIKKDFVNGLSITLNSYKIPAKTANAIALSLHGRMSDESLHYHTPAHVLGMIDSYQTLVERRNLEENTAFEIAVWFHDAIYIPGDSGNESMSAAFAANLLCPWVHKDLDGIKDLINATALYAITERVNPAFFNILDLDLSVMSTEYENFKNSCDLIRKEFSATPDEKFKAGRKTFFTQLLERPSIYRTEFFKKHFEKKARSNIERFLKEEL